ncbi:unnamed protein product [Polarella glacialis]|uniref:Uncharacterized protein n=1 Tax=Polarella glacialis TaxID=89957 RepID=A0A813KJ18_POLGL|nr:unnamed protein product [Polarella glacialis]|mmetsp:Transcript_57548/g.93192  ORF Transcript_57548/g.93192 Transcript_57548/m.93192 type:complete len:221 (+) Transcript_57548:82-744(+)
MAGKVKKSQLKKAAPAGSPKAAPADSPKAAPAGSPKLAPKASPKKSKAKAPPKEAASAADPAATAAKAKLAAEAVAEILAGIALPDAQKTSTFIPLTWHTKYKDALGAYRKFVKSQSEKLTIVVVSKDNGAYVIMKAGDKSAPPAGMPDVSRAKTKAEKKAAFLAGKTLTLSPKSSPKSSPKVAPAASPKVKAAASPKVKAAPAPAGGVKKTIKKKGAKK